MTSKLPEGWEKVELGEAINFNPKESIKKGTVAKKVGMSELLPFQKKISSFELAEYKGGTRFRNGDTLLARITPCLENGKTAQVDILDKKEVGFGSTEYIVLREREEITDGDFIYYLSISPIIRDVAIKSMTGTSGRQRAQRDVIENTTINLPPLQEQKEIADALSSLDDKIELNNKINENLEEQAQAIFKHWFVDFEFPDENGNPYKSSGGEMVESELGMIPKGWEVVKLDKIIELHDSKRIPLSKKQRDVMDKVYPYYGATSIIDYVDDYIFDGTYLLLGEDGSVSDDSGYPILQYVWGKIWVNNHAHIITGKDDVTVEYLYMLFKNTNVNNIITGAVQKKINQRNLKSLKVLNPIKRVMLKYIKTIKPIFKNKKLLYNQNQKLSQLRDTLLPKLMSGEIRLPLD